MNTENDELKTLVAEIRALREVVAASQRSSALRGRGVKPAALAADLGCHPRTIVRAIEDGRISAIPCGKSWSISRGEAERIKLYGLSSKEGGSL